MKQRLRSSLLGALALTAVMAVVTGCAGNTAGPGDEPSSGTVTIKLATSITGSSFLGVTAGLKEGIFAKHGIDLEVTKVKDTSTGVAALVSGQVDVAAMLTEGAIGAVAAGSDMKIIANLLTEDQHILYAGKGITKIEDFAGKKMAVVGPGSGTEILAKYLFEKAGIEDKVTYVPSGAASVQVASLIAGQVDGAGLVQPYADQAAAQGMNKILDYRDIIPGLTPQVFGASGAAIKDKPEALKKFVAAYAESTQWIVAHPDDAISILKDDAKVSGAIARSSFEFAKPDYSLDGKVSADGLQTWIRLTKEYGKVTKSVTVDDIYDPSFLPGS